ncbi:MAG TPA: helix-turn-helix transcriptional regulator [Candidatus Limiplasma sp.]|nr:helix-turn-helix transcriptional regulator [Candidatus Limiplasma sp.]
MQTRLKTIRKSMNLTQRQFADMIGVSRDVIASWEIGRVQPSEAILRLICNECAVNYAWLKYGEGAMEKPGMMDETEKLINIMEGDDPFMKAFLRGLVDMPKEAWEQMERFITSLQRKTEK